MVYNGYVQRVRFKYVSGYSLTMGFTNIRLRTETRDRLKARGFKGEDYDAVIVRLLDATEPPKEKSEISGQQGNFEALPVAA